ncbi:MAG: hypothetical protein ACK4GM_12920 [Tabrizicola sp.]
MIRATLLALSLSTPALAQDYGVVNFMARDLADSDPIKAYRSAVAACLVGKGDPAATTARFTEAGWTVTEDAEMGLTQIASPDPGLYVLTASDGSFCAAYSETLGTDEGIANVQIVAGAGGFSLASLDNPMGCIAFQLAPGVQGEITSSGNDPVCTDAATSSVRFTFGPVQ